MSLSSPAAFKPNPGRVERSRSAVRDRPQLRTSKRRVRVCSSPPRTHCERGACVLSTCSTAAKDGQMATVAVTPYKKGLTTNGAEPNMVSFLLQSIPPPRAPQLGALRVRRWYDGRYAI